MRTIPWLVSCLTVALLGCNSTSSRCETVCQWAQQCAGSLFKLDCSEAGIDRCVEEYDHANEACQEAFDNGTDCIEEQDLSCSGVQNRCVGQLSELVTRCDFEN